MPEGDTIHYAANRIRPVLLGGVPDEVRTPHPRFRMDRWPERLAGRAVEAVEAHGKHLFLRFEGDLTIHSHLRMTGSWRVHAEGRRWGRSPRRAWLVLHARGHDVVQFDGPVLDLLTESRRRFDHRIRMLGPDIIKDDFDEQTVLRRLREDDPTRPIGDALLDQRTVAGIGNLWKVESCFLARVDPWRPAGTVPDDEVLRILREARPRMQESARTGMQSRYKAIYGKAGVLCPRCGEDRIRQRGQGDDNRLTYWCPTCQK
ncbi:MAG: Fpg/Nei family DNA glycosylase [Solirubrobacterales bacterium]|nr:Fpg/Nei family DNA glycosylase [Solirubrobacterales bacterium]